MKKQHLVRKIVGVALGLTLLLAIGSFATVSAQGSYGNQDPRWDGYPNWGGSFELRQTALNAGYNEGNKQGQKDHGKRNNNTYQNQTAYQKGTKDYSTRLGDRSIYSSDISARRMTTATATASMVTRFKFPRQI